MSIDLKFTNVTKHAIHLLIYEELDSVLDVSKTCHVLTDYSAYFNYFKASIDTRDIETILGSDIFVRRTGS